MWKFVILFYMKPSSLSDRVMSPNSNIMFRYCHVNELLFNMEVIILIQLLLMIIIIIIIIMMIFNIAPLPSGAIQRRYIMIPKIINM